MIDGYAYALVIDGAEIKPWITGKDGALRDVNLVKAVRRHEAATGDLGVQSAFIIDQRIDKVVVRFPAHKGEIFA